LRLRFHIFHWIHYKWSSGALHWFPFCLDRRRCRFHFPEISFQTRFIKAGWQVICFNLIFYSQANVKLQGKFDKQKNGALGTTIIAKICHSPWSSFIFLLSKVHIYHKNSFGGAGGPGRKKLYWNPRIVASMVILNCF
jgi:hypothetical protein